MRTLAGPGWRGLLPALTGLALLVSHAPVQAQDTPRVAVSSFEGPRHAAVRQAVLQTLERHAIQTATADAATVLLTGAVSRNRGRLVLSLTVQTATAETVGSAQFKGRSVKLLNRAVSQGLLRDLGADIDAAHAQTVRQRQAPAPPPPPPAVVAKSSPTTVAAVEETGDPPQGALAITVGGQFFTRALIYTDDIYSELYGYRLPLGPAVGADARWYPGVHVWGASHPLANVGLRVQGHAAVGLSSEGDNNHDTSAWGATASLRGRVPVWDHELGLEAGLGTDRFSFADSGATEAPTPDTAYRFWRIGADTRFNFDRWSVGAGWAWRLVTDTGEIGTDAWFPQASVNAVEAHLALGYALTERLEVGLGAQWRRYAFTMNPEPGDGQIAGGALDQTFTGSVNMGWQL